MRHTESYLEQRPAGNPGEHPQCYLWTAPAGLPVSSRGLCAFCQGPGGRRSRLWKATATSLNPSAPPLQLESCHRGRVSKGVQRKCPPWTLKSEGPLISPGHKTLFL